MDKALHMSIYRKFVCCILLAADLLSAASCNWLEQENVPVQNMSQRDVAYKYAEAIFAEDDAAAASGYASAEAVNSLLSVTDACDPAAAGKVKIEVTPQKENDSEAEFKVRAANISFNGRKGAEADMTVAVLKKSNLIVRSSCKIKLSDGTIVYM